MFYLDEYKVSFDSRNLKTECEGVAYYLQFNFFSNTVIPTNHRFNFSTDQINGLVKVYLGKAKKEEPNQLCIL